MSSQGGSKGAMEVRIPESELTGPSVTERFNSREEMLLGGGLPEKETHLS